MRVRPRLGLVFAGLIVAGTACMFELPAPREDAIAEEGGATMIDGGQSPRPDGTTPGDTGGDDSSAPSSFCATVDATFCEDFGGAPFEDGRYEIRTSGGGTNKLVRDEVLSPPAALLSTTPSIDATRAWGYFKRALPGTVARGVRLEMAVRIDSAPPAGQHVMIAPIGIGGVWFTGLLLLPGGALTLTERTSASTFVDHGSAGALATGVWTRIAIDVSIPPEGRIVVSLDGNVTRDVAFSTSIASGAASIQFGISNAEPVGGPWSIRFDDVRADMR